MIDVSEFTDDSWKIDDVLVDNSPGESKELPASPYLGRDQKGIFLGVSSMKSHMTDEGNQLQTGLEYAGYELWGAGYPNNERFVPKILLESNPGVVVVQDKREWHVGPRSFRDHEAEFLEVHALARRHDIFKLTVLKDCQQRENYHKNSAKEMGCHAWIVYYHPRIVKHLAPYVREKHLVRTYHSLDPDCVPEYSSIRPLESVISGAACAAYPLRGLLIKKKWFIKGMDVIAHPGYHRRGSATPGYLKQLSQYKVSICTASRYGYALRKIIESTAAGCIVVTNLPSDDILPEIDGNLVRIRPDMHYRDINRLVQTLCENYNPERQRYYSDSAKLYYGYRARGLALADKIETLRKEYF